MAYEKKTFKKHDGNHWDNRERNQEKTRKKFLL